MDPNPLSTEPAGNVGPSAMAWTGQEVAFRRRFSSILDRQGRWLSFAILGLFGAVAAYLLLAPSPAPAQPPTYIEQRTDFNGIIAIVLCAALLAGYLLSRRYERLYIGHTGIRYVTWLGGPLAFLASFYPSWELRWDELTDIRLVKQSYSRGGMTWYYVFTPKADKERRTLIAWRPLGLPPEDTGLGLWQVLTKDVDAWKEAIARTQLFRLLDLAMRARKGQFKHPLIQDQ